jgi:hypothetical protein
MGQFRVVVDAVGGHGCMRELGDGSTVIGCERVGCVDCITREYVRRLKRSGAMVDVARLEHWHDREQEIPASGQIVDDLLTGVRAGSF